LFNNAKEALQGSGGKVTITSYKENDSTILSIDDSGPGISDENFKEVFKPFFTTKENGTGLGLPTVHRIVSELGGQIKLEKSELGGARFVITFRN
jgi:signal transduction histidine kinase